MTKTNLVFHRGQFSLRQAFMITNLVILAIGTLFTLVILGVAFQAKREEMNLRLASRAETARHEIDRVFLEAQNSVRKIANGLPEAAMQSAPAFEKWSRAEISRRLAEHPAQLDLYFGFTAKYARKIFGTPGMVYVVTKDPAMMHTPRFQDPETYLVKKYPDPAYLTNRAERWYHSALERQDFYFSPFYFDVTYLQTIMLSVTQAVHNTRTGERIGIAGADISARSLGELLAGKAQGRTGGVLLTDEHGAPIAPILRRPVPMIGHLQDAPPADRADFALAVPGAPRLPLESGTREFRGSDGERYFIQARRLNQRHFYVVAYQQRIEAYAPLYWTLGIIMALATCFLAVSLYFRQKLASFVTENVDKILSNLRRNQRLLEQTADAPFDPVEPAGPAEIARISEQLNGLYRRLHAAFAEIHSQRDRAELATRTKSRFLSVMSHEIRTPLNSMLGLTDVLMLSPLNSEQIGHLRVLQRSGQSLLRILNDILDFSRLEAGKLELEQVEFDLFELLYDLENLMRFDAEAKGLRFRMVAPACNYRIVGDSVRLRQAILNLVGNSIKFTATGEVEVNVSTTSPVKPPLQAFRFEVIDTGIGMTPEQQSRIFSEFAQADASITRRYGGTGLGLSISRQIIQLLGGKLEVRSEIGRGSTFYFTVPLRVLSTQPIAYPDYCLAMSAQGTPPTGSQGLKPDSRVRIPETRPASPTELSSQRRVANPKILVVDDDEDNHRLIDAYMRFRPDLGAVHSFSAADALARLAREDFELILMDMQMPAMDGLDATIEVRRLQKNARLPHRPIVMLSANTFAEDRQKSLEAGADEHVGKPIKLEEFQRLLDRWIPPAG